MGRRFRAGAALLTAGICLATVALPASSWDRPLQTQGEMNLDAAKEYRRADAELNAAYKRLLAGLDSNPRARLIKAQQAWIPFRDAEARFRASSFSGGTAEPAMYWTGLRELTEQRTKDLRAAYKELVGD